MKTKIALFSIGLLLFLVSCQNTNTAALSKEWTLVSINDTNYEAYSVTLNINQEEEKTVAGKSFCNNYFSNATIATGGVISFGVIASTKKACLDANLGAYENDYFRSLEQVTSWLVNGENLILSSETVKIAYR